MIEKERAYKIAESCIMGTITTMMEADNGSPFIKELHEALEAITHEGNQCEDVQAVIDAAKKISELDFYSQEVLSPLLQELCDDIQALEALQEREQRTCLTRADESNWKRK